MNQEISDIKELNKGIKYEFTLNPGVGDDRNRFEGHIIFYDPIGVAIAIYKYENANIKMEEKVVLNFYPWHRISRIVMGRDYGV